MIFIYAGSTSQTIDVFIPDSASTTGGGKTGLVFNTSNLAAYYRKGATGTATAITLATQTVGGAYSSGGFVEIDATNMPGMYRLDLPNAAVDTAGLTHVMLRGASGMAPTVVRVMCSAVAADAKLLGGTTQTGRDVGASVLLSSGTGAGQISLSSGLVTLAGVTHTGAVIPTVTTTGTATTATNLTNLPSIPANWLTAAGIAALALNGKGDWNVGKTGYALTAGTGLGNQTANITGNLSGSVGSVTGAVGSVTAAVTAGTVSDKTGYSLTAGTGLGNQTANITGNLSGSVGSVTGAVGSVTGDVGGNVVGSVASVTAAVTLPSIPAGWITAAGIATGAVDADALAADAVTKIWAGSTAPTATTIADAVLSRGASNVEASAGEHTLCTVILATLESRVSGSTWTIKRTDGTTTHASKTVTTDAAANPITEVS
jgi:hypothetical protein